MSFLRHGESIDPMTLVPLGVSGLAHSQCSSASMSSSRLFLGRLLSSRACLRFADRERFSKTKPRRTMIFQRTATPPLTSCLSPRVHSKFAVPFPRPHPWLQRKSINGKCANLKLSQRRGSPHFTVPSFVPCTKRHRAPSSNSDESWRQNDSPRSSTGSNR
jgi:hypothetical protein